MLCHDHCPSSRAVTALKHGGWVPAYASLLERCSKPDFLIQVLTLYPLHSREVMMFVTRADGRMVTIYAPRYILATFVKTAELPSELAYHIAQWIGWTAFGAHIIVLGMSTLFTQIYTVVLLVLSTWAMCHDFAFDTGRESSEANKEDFVRIPFTGRLFVEQVNPPKLSLNGDNIDKRMIAYVRANPTENQELMRKHWSMLPFPGVPWYKEYERAKQEHQKRWSSQSRLIRPTSKTSMSTEGTLSPLSPLPTVEESELQ